MKLEINRFEPDDRVVVISSCGSNGDTGSIVKYHKYSSGFNKYIGVRMDNGDYKQFNED